MAAPDQHSMSLREQPIPDQYQDAIFRRPLNSEILILGPPSSGKTTTLIKRLGMKAMYIRLPRSRVPTNRRTSRGPCLDQA